METINTNNEGSCTVAVRRVVRLINWINEQMYIVIGLCITFLAAMIFYDVIARYFFNRPTSFGYDTTLWVTGLMAFMGGGFALLKNEHVRIDLFYEKFPDRVKAYVDLFSHIFLFIIIIALVWSGGGLVLGYFKEGTVATSGLNIPLWVKFIIVPLGGILLGLQGLVNLIKDVYFIVTRRKFEEDR